MPLNRLALIRYKTIDACLTNNSRKWTLENLIDACSEALYEYEGIDRGVSKRTVQYDIQMMRSEKLGYEAPIVVKSKKYYCYDNPDYSIMKGALTDADASQLAEAVAVLKQFKGFGHMQELGGLVQKLEDKVRKVNTDARPAIMLETNERLKGLEHLDTIYQAVNKQKVIRITYQSFQADKPKLVILHPYLLREYNNRWFLVGSEDKGQRISNFALDRIHAVTCPDIVFRKDPDFDPATYFKHVVGVTVLKGEPKKIHLRISARNAPYVLTKPIHSSQKVLKKEENGKIIVTIDVIPNYELESHILSFGSNMEVLKPIELRNKIQRYLQKAVRLYEKEE